jgi:hypothetical protein
MHSPRKIQIAVAFCAVTTIEVIVALVTHSASRTNRNALAASPKNTNSVSFKNVSHAQTVKGDPLHDFKQSIEFYGKVVEQNVNPVEGAQVRLSWTDLSVNGSSEKVISTDGNGSFTFKGGHGSSLCVVIDKKGYSRETSQRICFGYDDPSLPDFHRPDPKNPVIFRMFKHGPSQTLLHRKIVFAKSSEGQEQTVSIQANDGGPAIGPLIVRSWTPKRSESDPKPDWKFELKLTAGEILPTNDSLPLEAPETGYLDSSHWEFKKALNNWRAEFDQVFYFRTISPVFYGRMHVRFLSWGDEVIVEYWLNPIGARSLDEGAPK